MAVGCTESDADTTAAVGRAAVETSPLPTVPPAQPPSQLTRAEVETAVSRLDGVVRDAMRRTGVPGVALGVVHDDKVLYLKGFGVRTAGTKDRVGVDTVFQLASVSKPLASTVVGERDMARGPRVLQTAACPTTPGTSWRTSATTARTSWTTSATNRSPPSAPTTRTPTSG
ncbi:serine hydrolase [Streptomyces sp. NPDC001759]